MSPARHRARSATTPATAVLAVTAALAAATATLAPPATAAPSQPEDGYANPVSADFADTYADPAVIRGKDGWWYAYGTTDPLREGDPDRRLLPISRSSDLLTWEYVGDAFTEDTVPAWADRSRNAALWAPDIRYVDGRYRLYYVVTDTTVTDEPNDNAIGVATAPTPAGPWTDSGAPVVGPRRGGAGEPGNFLWTFDPSYVRDEDGTGYLYYGSYYGGIFVTELNEAGTAAVGEPTRVTIDNKYEGAYVVRHEDYWYLFVSSANCCAGPVTGYSVHVGRSADLRGPFVDREGVPLDTSRAGGTPVIAPNGNRWVGTGHNAVVTDLAGQDWLAYHAIDVADPYLNEPFGINERPMLLDRLDWIDGWPTVNAGSWASEQTEQSPTTSGRRVSDFESGIDRVWRRVGAWSTATDADSGGFAVSRGGTDALLLSRGTTGRDVRVEADLRVRADAGAGTAAGLVTGWRDRRGQVVAYVDPAGGRLVIEAQSRGSVTARAEATLPAGLELDTWRSAVLEIRGGTAHAELSDARLGDPLARVSLDLPGGRATAGSAGAYASGGGVEVDNLSVLDPARLVTTADPQTPVGTARLGRLDRSAGDEFSRGALAPGWTAVRDPQVSVVDGNLIWPTEAADLVGTGNDASILLRRPPAGDWTAETKVGIDLGVDTVRNFSQAGLIAYVNDDEFRRLSHVAIFNTRQTEFGTETVYEGRPVFGGTIVGPPAETTWLRLTSRGNSTTGGSEVQASTSADGRTWVDGGVWTLPAGADVQVGLISHGGAGATATFDYLRFYPHR